MKTNELIGLALDWAVAKCEGVTVEYINDGITKCLLCNPSGRYAPSINWSQAGPIIEREGISMRFSPKDSRGNWFAVLGPNRFLSPDFEGFGPTPLIAAMRCYVASKLGDEVDVPNELSLT